MSPTRQDRKFMQHGAEQAAAMLRTLGNEQRLLLLCLLMEHGEMTVGQMQAQVDLSQSALSQHLARMREDGLVVARREAQSAYYRIDDPRVETLVAALKSVFCP
ncbi:metalloregulator ArsR/SmtB family transcription factor [Pseudoxanthomonas daejeonensis]|jgi:DNA-binding transcriptional ArsR family regulator|uniref:Transcriptional regulator n=1 Tax=Pseudoxanthomonas daejeonensis TaxID=266062 RepID=A0ABQ6Z6T6_9GAMM|nr:metalloregulator ArsR/SmtB family transcription factor [Pseudoxanthomonas daejeonensis]KAF1694379.1 transcriptional regulator [Pseudoxanthomonas daejeonensis]UNK58843.1 metalloregulator ArsR/SmtB family transcription factor [Pseudoxanthomonas daejeonensis]